VLIGGIVAVLVVAGLVAAFLTRRRSDDVHSVEHYHRQLHTLQEMREHPSADAAGNGHQEGSAYPASAFRVSSSSTVRLTDPDRPLVPPVPPPPVPKTGDPVVFDEEPAEVVTTPQADTPQADTAPTTNFMRDDDRALHSIDHRPRKLGAPLAAVGVVLVLIIVLIVTGLHTTTPSHHGKSSTATTTHVTTPTTAHRAHHPKTTTTTTAPPVVSLPKVTSPHAATYQVASDSFSLVLSASNGECWVDATTASGTSLFTGTLFTGQSHTVTATGAVTVVAGAPAAFAATVNGAAVSLPFGYQAPFTLTFQTPGSVSSATGSSGSGPTTG
jgi:Domain of unknown function (DUF4115)